MEGVVPTRRARLVGLGAAYARVLPASTPPPMTGWVACPSTIATRPREGAGLTRSAHPVVQASAHVRVRVDIRLEMARTVSPSTTASQITEDVDQIPSVHIQDQEQARAHVPQGMHRRQATVKTVLQSIIV